MGVCRHEGIWEMGSQLCIYPEGKGKGKGKGVSGLGWVLIILMIMEESCEIGGWKELDGQGRQIEEVR